MHEFDISEIKNFVSFFPFGDHISFSSHLSLVVRWMTQVKKNSLHPPRYQGCNISSCREFCAEFNAKCCQSGILCRKFVNMIF